MPGRSQTSSPRRSSRMALRRRARRSLVGFTATDVTQPDELLRRWTWPRFPRPAWSRSMRRIRRPGPAAAFGSPGKAARPLLTSRSSSGRISPAHWRPTPGRRRGRQEPQRNGERGSGRSSLRQLTESTDRSTRSPASTSTAGNVGTTRTAARTFALGQQGPAPSRPGSGYCSWPSCRTVRATASRSRPRAPSPAKC
jgi:hypothetical protein